MIHERRSDVLWLVALCIMVASCQVVRSNSPHASPGPPAVTRAISMAVLHQSGGVPPGWKFTPPPGDPAAGRQVFVSFGCSTCHTVQGEQSPSAPSAERSPGPDLTGMGSFHPPEYFVESILNPSAVLVDGPGYVGADGRSIMPSYPEMTLAQLADVVAYLQSLKGDSTQHAHMHPTAGSFLVQAVDVTAKQFDAFDEWFDRKGTQDLKTVNGLVSLDTYVTRTPKGRLVITLFGFEDDVVLDDFVKRLDSPNCSDQLGALLHRGAAALFRSPPVYRAIGLSLP